VALMQISIIPMGTSTPSVGEFIADVQAFLLENDCTFELNDMGTVIYGPPENLFLVAAKIHGLPFEKGAQRVVTNITVDDWRGRDRHPGDKKNSVFNILLERNNER